MNYSTLISPQEASELCGAGDLLIVDCRSDLADPAKGRRDWAAAHLPGAVHADLNRDLSDLSKLGLGRHPLPDAAQFASVLARWGWTPSTQVIAYDDVGGAMAGRLWWMLRLAGHEAAAVLDGGIVAWKHADLPLSIEHPLEAAGEAELALDDTQVVGFDELQRGLAERRVLLLDARAAARFAGDVEPIDPVAGHVPGARNRPFGDNLVGGGRFKPAEQLREEFDALLADFAPEQVVHMCGSGVTACHNLLAMEHAGLTGSRVFAPSWSGWIADPARPVARGKA
jgi:thiosulfate/3-mercaptopyruvate sulfurtransferase